MSASTPTGAQLALHFADLREPRPMLLVRTVAEVEAEHIDAGEEQRG
jgi:hypothetical protein